MVAATQTGVNNSTTFLKTVKDQGEQSDLDTVSNLLKANNWQGVVDYATTFSYYNFKKKPFTAADVDVGLNPWMLLAIPDNYDDKNLKGSMIAIRLYSGVGFGILGKGGTSTIPSGDVLATASASADAGTPVGSPYTLPLSSDGSKSDWILSQTSNGKLAFFKGATCRFVLTNNGTVWTQQNSDMKAPPMERSDGNLIPGASGGVTAGSDIKTSFSTYAAQAWSVAATDLGNLAFRSESNNGGTTIMIADGASGSLCNGTGAIFKADDFKISWQGYVDYLWGQFTNYTDEGVAWLSNIANTSASWLENAAMDTWGWVENTSSEAWNEVKGGWNDVQDALKGVDDQIKDVGDKISDPNTWNPTKW